MPLAAGVCSCQDTPSLIIYLFTSIPFIFMLKGGFSFWCEGVGRVLKGKDDSALALGSRPDRKPPQGDWLGY